MQLTVLERWQQTCGDRDWRRVLGSQYLPGRPSARLASPRRSRIGKIFTNFEFYQFLAKFRQNVARFRLYRHRFLQLNMRFAAFFKIYQILKLKFLKCDKILQHLQNFAEFQKFHLDNLVDF